MLIKLIARSLVAALALLLFAAPSHANFFGSVNDYPFTNAKLVETFTPGYYRINNHLDGSKSRVLIEKLSNGMYHVESSMGAATFGFVENIGDTYVMFGGDGGKNYGYSIVTRSKRGVVTVYSARKAAKLLLGRRVEVKRMPTKSPKQNKQFLQDLLQYSKEFTVVYTATPEK